MERTGKLVNYFRFRILPETGAGVEQLKTEAEMAYTDYRNGGEPENLAKYIIV